jgi:hypothetical protein
MLHQAGIDDVELSLEIRRLDVGNPVVLTFLKDVDSRAGET